MNTYDTTETHINVPSFEEDVFHDSIEQENDLLLVHVIQRNPRPPGYLHRLLSDSNNPSTTTTSEDNNIPCLVNNTCKKCITIDGIKYRSISNVNVVYYYYHAIINKGSFVDHSANSGLCGTDVRLMEKTGRSVDI